MSDGNEKTTGDVCEQAAVKQAATFDASNLPSSRVGGTHCTHINSTYGLLGKDDTFTNEEKQKGYGVNWAQKLKGKISRFT